MRVAADQQATLAPEAVKARLDVVPRLMSRLGKPSPTLSGRNLIVGVPTSAPDTEFGFQITDRVTLIDPPTAPDATLVLRTESRPRLAGGRLSATATQRVTVTGPLDLDTVEVGGQRDVQPLSRTARRRATRGGFSVRCGSR